MAKEENYSNEDMASAFFGDWKNLPKDSKIPCRGGCGKTIKKPKNGGATNFISHITGIHGDTMMDVYNAFVNVKVLVKGPMDTFNALRYKSPMAAKVHILNVMYFVNKLTRHIIGFSLA